MVSELDRNARALSVAFVGAGAVLGLLVGLNPQFGLGFALGIGFLMLVAVDLSLALAAFAVLSFLDVLPAGAGAAAFGNLATALFILAWLAAVATREGGARTLVDRHPGLSYLLILFFAWAAISLLRVENTASGVDALKSYVFGAILFVIAFTAIRERQQAVRVVAALIAGGVVAACFGIASPPAAEASFSEVARIGGGSLGPNELAATLVAAIALSLAFLAGRERPVVKMVALGAVGVCLLGVMLTLSRGGLLALSVALIAAAVFGGGRRRVAAAGLVLVVAVGVVGYFTVVASPEARERVSESNSGTGRTDIWKVGWRMVEDKPVTGVGVGNFKDASIHYLLAPGVLKRDDFIVDEPKVAHNIYLEVLAELGVVGLVLFLGIIGVALRCAWRAAQAFAGLGDLRMELLARAVLISLLGLLAADFFISDQYSKLLWLLLSLGPSLLAVAEAQEARQPIR